MYPGTESVPIWGEIKWSTFFSYLVQNLQIGQGLLWLVLFCAFQIVGGKQLKASKPNETYLFKDQAILANFDNPANMLAAVSGSCRELWCHLDICIGQCLPSVQ